MNQALTDRPCFSIPGFAALLVLLALMGLGALNLLHAHDPSLQMTWVGLEMFFGFLLTGLKTVNPNEARVLQFFGSYAGTLKLPGLRWINPLCSARTLSQRVRSFDSTRLKVNDLEGNPIEIGVIVVWRVHDCAEACFSVDDYGRYVAIQTEAAVRGLASRFPYDAHKEGTMALRANTEHVAEILKNEIQARLGKAGVTALEARISHLAYAPEIAQAMLQRQQAGAILAARALIVEGAVGIVETALARLAQDQVVQLTEERKAMMVANLLTVLCSERPAQTVINAGME